VPLMGRLWTTPQRSLLLGIARNKLGQHRIEGEAQP
jgi:hypothetical protein